MEQPPLKTYRDVIALWRTRAALARWVSKKEGTVRGWYQRDSISEPDFAAVVEAARACGFEGVSYALLSGMRPGAALETPPA